jgi:hypothetical protein
MLQDAAKVAVGVVVEADLDDVQVADHASKVVVMADVHLVTKDVDAVSMVETVDVVVG